MLEHFRATREAKDAREPRDIEAEELEASREPDLPEYTVPPTVNPTILDSRAKGPNLRTDFEADKLFMQDLRTFYNSDPLFKKIIDRPNDHPHFRLSEES
ncbi:hypothetical protein VNI00_017271, partial [Paramarasmius palmivorus]